MKDLPARFGVTVNVLMAILILLLTTVLGLYVWSQITGRGTNHEDLRQELEATHRAVLVNTCFFAYPLEQRTPARRAICEAEAALLIP